MFVWILFVFIAGFVLLVSDFYHEKHQFIHSVISVAFVTQQRNGSASTPKETASQLSHGFTAPLHRHRGQHKLHDKTDKIKKMQAAVRALKIQKVTGKMLAGGAAGGAGPPEDDGEPTAVAAVVPLTKAVSIEDSTMGTTTSPTTTGAGPPETLLPKKKGRHEDLRLLSRKRERDKMERIKLARKGAAVRNQLGQPVRVKQIFPVKGLSMASSMISSDRHGGHHGGHQTAGKIWEASSHVFSPHIRTWAPSPTYFFPCTSPDTISDVSS